jgi:RHS repeat-associated protein
MEPPAYDVLGRPVGVTAADSTQSTTIDYDGFTVTTLDAGGRGNRLIADALGRATVTIGTISRTFSYGAERERYKQVWVSGSTTRTYTYIGEHYVKEVQGSATEHKLYIFANGEPVAYVSDDGTPDTHYFHKDHLGSVTTIIVNQSWSGREKLSYDAWGRRRSGTDWWSAAATASEERGYTGHEHLDDVTLIHMNGRLLDPKLGRVISADPTVPAPLFSQSFNRFSYAYNNPLKYTDPSGFGPCDYVSLCRLGRALGEHMTPCPLGSCGSGSGGVDSGYVAPMSQEYMDAWLAAFFAWQNEPAGQAEMMLAIKGPADSLAKTDQGGLPPTSQATFVGPLENPTAYRLAGPVSAQTICHMGCHGVDYRGRRYENAEEREFLNAGGTLIIVTGGAAGVYELIGAVAGTAVAATTIEFMEVTQMATNDVPLPIRGGVQANKAAGDAVRDAIAQREAPALTEQVFNTVGGARRVDVLKLGDELVGIESKVGRTALDSRIRQELARDWWLQRQSKLDRVIWEFSRSERTGKIGPTSQLAEKLEKLGFETRINE